MKKIDVITVSILFFAACGVQDAEQTIASNLDTTRASVIPVKATPAGRAEGLVLDRTSAMENQTYSNKRFRNVTIQPLANDSFLITGKGQIFEASFNWVIEDGHEELQHSYSTTDAGAPEWGNFRFKIHAPKKRPNSTLHLVLFETSAKDGSRQHELPLFLH